MNWATLPGEWAVGADGFTLFWLYKSVHIEGRVMPHTTFSVRKYFIEPIEDEL